MHKVIKYDFGVKGTNLMVAAKRLTLMLEQTSKEMRDARAGYKTKWGKQKGVPKYPKKTKKREKSQTIVQVDSNYDLTYGVAKSKKQSESSNKRQRVLNIISDVEIPNSYKEAVFSKNSSKGQPLASFSWSRNSCPLDSVLAALLLVYCWIEGKWGIQAPVDRCDVATINFFNFFYEHLKKMPHQNLQLLELCEKKKIYSSRYIQGKIGLTICGAQFWNGCQKYHAQRKHSFLLYNGRGE